ncbi:nuclear transport factor 2 family protein [Glycomyces salinus]|uniref:nuclear transport factor 2 family protein n=1 Tax=Glycomyces salinus TaxID=980294 RepID=UPI0018EA839B|nr:nuclear transport factor 2 family protein [Glycomyces salinus]
MTAEDEVHAVSAALDAALVGNDASTISGFFAHDWIHVGPDGITPKAALIGWIASGRLAHHSMETAGVPHMVSTGDTVLVTARRMSTGTWDGVPYSADEWITDVYVRAEENWRCALSQKTTADGDRPARS